MKLTSVILATAVALGFAVAPSLAQDPVKAPYQKNHFLLDLLHIEHRLF